MRALPKLESSVLSRFLGTEKFYKARLLFYFTLVSLLFAVSYFFLTYITHLPAVRINMAVDAILFIGILYWIKAGGNLKAAQHTLVFVCWLTCIWLITISGGLHSSVMAWLALIPVMSLILSDKTSGLIWTIISVLTVLFFTYLYIQNIPLPLYPITQTPIFVTPVFAGAILILVWLTFIFDEQILELIQRQEKSNKQLSDSERELRDSMEELKTIQASLSQRERDISATKSKLERFISAAMEMVKSPEVQWGDYEKAIQLILGKSAAAMGVSRVSIWEYEKKPGQLRCLSLLQVAEERYDSGMTLDAKDYPTYFKHILSEGLVCAAYAETDFATSEFRHNYLSKLSIKSVLDAPYYVKGEFKGVVCFEMQNQVRVWSSADQLFAKSVADIVGLTFVSSELQGAIEAIQSINASLEQRVKERTLQLSIQNQQLLEYAHINGHQLRAPLCRVLGLVYLIESNKLSQDEFQTAIRYLSVSAEQLDNVVQKISNILIVPDTTES